jgi:hypothetical protein
MHTSYQGLQTTVAAWQMRRLYERTLNRLEATGQLTPRRARAASQVLWPTAHAIAHSHLRDACDLIDRIRKWDPDFQPTDPSRLLRFLYARLGYRRTQSLLRLRRWILRRPA